MKKRPAFKVAGLDSLESRELLSTLSTFRPQVQRSAFQSTLKTNQQPASTSTSSSTETSTRTLRSAFHVQGGPTATFLAQQRAANNAPGSYSALLRTAIARRAQRLSGLSALSSSSGIAASSVASSTPTKLAPALPFAATPTGSSLNVSPVTRGPQIVTRTVTPSAISPIKLVANPSTTIGTTPTTGTVLSNPIGVIKSATATANTSTSTTTMVTPPETTSPATTTVTTATPVASTASTATTGNPSMLTKNEVDTLKQAVDTFAGSYTSGVNTTQDQAALVALNTSLEALGTSALPTTFQVSQGAVNTLQSQINAFVNSSTGGADSSTDVKLLNALSTALAGFQPSSTTASTSTATTTPTTVSASGGSVVSPVVTGLINGITNTGTLSATSLKSLQSAVSTFASNYSYGSNATTDKAAEGRFFSDLSTLANSQFVPVLLGATTATPVSVLNGSMAKIPAVVTTTTTTTPSTTTTSEAMPIATTNTASTGAGASTTTTVTPSTSSTSPTATTTPMPLATATTSSTSTSTATTSNTDTNATKSSSLLFTAIRAPGV